MEYYRRCLGFGVKVAKPNWIDFTAYNNDVICIFTLFFKYFSYVFEIFHQFARIYALVQLTC